MNREALRVLGGKIKALSGGHQVAINLIRNPNNHTEV